jgi:hypothetical protein
MKIGVKVIFVIFCLLLISGFALADAPLNTKNAQPDKIVMEKNKALALCREVHEILQRPENIGYIRAPEPVPDLENFVPTRKGLFTIPENFKNFRPVVWKTGRVEEFSKAFPDAYKATMAQKAALKDPSPLVVKTTEITLLKDIGKRKFYKIDYKKAYAEEIFMAETPKDQAAKKFNEHNRVSGYGFFYYKGKVFSADKIGSDALLIYEPNIIEPFNEFFMLDVCIYNALRGE